MLYNFMFWHNGFRQNDGVHSTICPRTLITGHAIEYNRHFKVAFGTTSQVHEEGEILLSPRTLGAIALQPT